MTILMKRIMKITFWVLFISLDVVGLLAFSNSMKYGQYTVDTEEISTTIEWSDNLSLEDIKIVDNRLFGLVETNLTSDMIVAIEDTDVAGQKKVIFEHNNKQFEVIIDVKYKVEFFAYGEVVDTQTVGSPDELVLTTPKAKPGYEFSHWDYDFSLGFNDNIQVNAVFKEIDYPAIPNLSATYGDTLADLELPSNTLGRWEFMMPAETPVGDAGKQYYNVRFVFNVDEGYYKYGSVLVNVAPKELEFHVDTESFVYDGQSHFPAYTLDANVNDVIVGGSANTEAGVYDFTFVIVDPNYVGSYTGSYEITKPNVTVTVSSANITYPQAIPEFTYTVEGFDNYDNILGIELSVPKNTAAGTYEIVATCSNTNVNCTIINGQLVINYGTKDDVVPPTYVAPTFGDRLGDVEITGNYLGTWSWENPDTIIDNINGMTVYAIFQHEDTNYADSRVAVEITGIKKKTLNITVLKSDFTYVPGGEYKVLYEIEGGDYSDVVVEGNEVRTTAGTESRYLYINDPRYEGGIRVEFVVNQATPETDFTHVYELVWTEGLTIDAITLPAGYTWGEGAGFNKAGEYTFTAIYTPDDTVNYKTVTGQFTVKVAKAETVFSGIQDSYEKTYDTVAFDIKNSGISVYHTDGILSITYYKDGVEVSKIVNSGVYTVVISVSEGTNYLAGSETRTVVVNVAENTQSVQTTQSATYGDSIDTLVLPADLEGSWSWLETTIGNAGTNTLTAVYTPDANGNYAARAVSVTVNVSKKTVNVPAVSDKEYTGEEISQGLTDTAEYTVSGDLVAIDVDTYYVTFTLVDPDNYEWFGDPEHASITKTYKISIAPNSWVVEPMDISTVYNGSPVYVTAEGLHGDVEIIYTLNGVVVDAPVGVGTYKATVKVIDPNYDELTKTVTIVISKATVTVPTVSTSFSYNGTLQGFALDDSNLNVLYVVESEVKGTNAGDVVSMSLKLVDSANYKWNTTDADTVNFTTTIAKAKITFATATKISKDSWTYTETEGAASAAEFSAECLAFGATANLKFSVDNVNFVDLSDLARTNGLLNAGKYYVKTVVAGSANWDAAETTSVAFEVKKATPNKVVADWSGSVMNGTLYYQNLLNFAGYTVYIGDIVVPNTLNSYGISSAGFAGENTYFTFNVTPHDTTNFNVAAIDCNVPLVTVATIGFNGTPYGTIEDALVAATSGQEVWVKLDNTGNVYITNSETAIVKSGVTLVLPYGNASNADGRNQSTTASLIDGGDLATKNPALRVNVVKIAENTTLTVNGSIEICGLITGGSGGHMSGHTAGNYAAIELENNASLVVNGSARVFGYIDNAINHEGKVVVDNGGTILMPWILIDYRGGTIMASIYQDMDAHATAPLQQFTFFNVTSLLRINYGGTMMGTCNLVASDKVQHEDSTFVSSDSKGLIQLTDSTYSYLEAKLDPDTKITKLDIYGGAKANTFNISIKYMFSTYKLDSSKYYFAIPWCYNITLDNNSEKNQTTANFEMPNKYKILPGGSITVEEGAVLNVNNLTVFKNIKPEWQNADGTYPRDKGAEGYYYDYLDGTYPGTGVYLPTYHSVSSLAGTHMPDGILMVRGTLNATNLGGDVYTTGGSGTVKITGSTTMTTYEPTTVTKATLGGSVDTWQTMYTVTRLIYTDGTSNGEGGLTALSKVSSVVKNMEYVANTSANKWEIVLSDTVDIVLGNGYGVYTEFAVLTDSEGNRYPGVYDSRDTKQNGTITVLKNAVVNFYLDKNQLLVLDGSKQVALDTSHVAVTSTGTYEQSVTVTSSIAPKVYAIPAFTISSSVSGTVTYSNLSDSGIATVSVVISVSNTVYQNGKLSLKITGIDPANIAFSYTGIAGADSGTGEYVITGSNQSGNSVSVTATITITSDVAETIGVSSEYEQGTKKECVTPDTLITLADGTQVRVDSLTGNELLLVWNLETGKFDVAPIMFIDSETLSDCKVISLYFSDGTVVKVIGEHGFWDCELNRYVYLDANAAEYIGHTFLKQSGDELAKVQLVNVEINVELTTAWSPVTVGHLCYFVNGMLSMPGGVGGLFNIFEVDSETMTYDYEAMERDIAEYGLFTYEEMNALCPLSEDMFYAAGGAYLKISIGKGNLTVEELIAMIERYSKYV